MALLLPLLPIGTAASAESDRLTILYPDMSPFIEPGLLPGQVKGELADWINAIAEEAGIDLVWTGPVPRARILADMQAGTPACHPNARLTVDRDGQYKFTQPVVRASDWVVVALSESRVSGFVSLHDLLQATHLTPGILQGQSFGPDLDTLVEARRPGILSVRGGPDDLLKLLLAGRIDWMLADRTALGDAVEGAGIRLEDIGLVRFPDMPRPEPGRMMCALSVPDDMIDRLNAAINRMEARLRAR